MLVKLSTDKTVTETAAALQIAVQANYFGVMQVHNLKETMAKKGVEFAHECLIFEVCQPQQAKKVLDQNMSVSTALPCRISLYEEGGGVRLIDAIHCTLTMAERKPGRGFVPSRTTKPFKTNKRKTIMKTTHKTLVAALAGIALFSLASPLQAQSKAVGNDGIAASPKVLQVLTEIKP